VRVGCLRLGQYVGGWLLVQVAEQGLAEAFVLALTDVLDELAQISTS